MVIIRPLADPVPTSLASMTPEVQIAKQSSSPRILETKSKRFALVAASANSSMRS